MTSAPRRASGPQSGFTLSQTNTCWPYGVPVQGPGQRRLVSLLNGFTNSPAWLPAPSLSSLKRARVSFRKKAKQGYKQLEDTFFARRQSRTTNSQRTPSSREKASRMRVAMSSTNASGYTALYKNGPVDDPVSRSTYRRFTRELRDLATLIRSICDEGNDHSPAQRPIAGPSHSERREKLYRG